MRNADECSASLTFNLKSVRDLLAKVRRDAAALDDEVTSDRFFNFVITAYSLIDWIKTDPTVPQTAKEGQELDFLYAELQVCGEIANSSKHFALKERKRSRITSSVTSKRGYGVGRWERSRYGVGEEHILIILSDGTAFGALGFKDDVLRVWNDFFARHGI